MDIEMSKKRHALCKWRFEILTNNLIKIFRKKFARQKYCNIFILQERGIYSETTYNIHVNYSSKEHSVNTTRTRPQNPSKYFLVTGGRVTSKGIKN